MTESLSVQLATSGIDYDEALERFGGNAALYQRLAVKFLDDPHFSELDSAFASNDIGAAERAAHAFKGVAGNLSFGVLFKVACRMNELLRAGNFEAARALMSDLRPAYGHVCEALQNLPM